MMLDEYYRNGELFLAEMGKDVKITDEFIRANFREPIKELVGHSNIGDASTEKEMLRALMKYFEVSGRSSEILNASFFSTGNGRCSYCGEEKDVFPNRAYIFPFERKIDSIAPEEARQQFCKKCGFTLYSGMAYLYQKGSLQFFFDSYNLEHIKKMSIPFKDLRDPANFNRIKKFGILTFHPHETVFATLFEFVKYLHRKKLVGDFEDTIGKVRLVVVAGSGQIYHQKYVEGNVLDKVSKFFLRLIEEGIENWRNMNEKKRPKKTTAEDLILAGFFNNLTVNKGDFSENCRLREEFTRALLDTNPKIDFITLNEIIMERLKKVERVVVPYHYRSFITTFMEVFGMEKEMFEKINGLGYALGKELTKEKTNPEKFVWDVFRARGTEQFYNSLVELQAKLKKSIDLRAINEYEKGWREAKAILLNGMLNALYGGR